MENCKGFPCGVLAIDGTLVKIERPHDYEGWYCCKGFLAFNVQIVMDYTHKIRDFDIRPGSASNKQIFANSWFGQNIHQILPCNALVLANAGYTLMFHILTPYLENEIETVLERNYNYILSSTRMVVECGLGIFKNRFQIFLKPLNMAPRFEGD